MKCELLPQVEGSSQLNEQASSVPDASNSLELTTGAFPTVPWSIPVGGAGTEIHDVTTDTSGNVYVTGESTSANDSNTFVAKLDSNGITQWSYSFQEMIYDEGDSIAVDANGTIFITGWTQTYISSDGSNKVDVLIAKLSSSGVVQWTKTYGNLIANDFDTHIALDGDGNIYVTGKSQLSWGSPIQPITLDQYDTFVARFDPNTGNLIWNTFLGEGRNGNGMGIAADSAGNVYVTSSSFIPGSPSDLIVAKLNSGGILLWNTAFRTAGTWDHAYDIALDGNGNIYIAGESWASWGSPLNAYTPGSADAFVVKLSNNGNVQWNTFMGGIGSDLAYGIDVDTSGNIFISGPSTNVWGNPFDSGTGTPQRVFVAKLDTNGILEWNTFIKGESWYYSSGLLNKIALRDGSIYIASQLGTFDSPIAFLTKIEEPVVSEPVQIEVTDSVGNSVNELALNGEGWPTPNPLTVNVTLYCPIGNPDCNNYSFNFILNSTNSSGRFFLYDSTLIPDGSNCFGDIPGLQNSFGSFVLTCNDISLFAGQSVSYVWKLWVQPSDVTQLNFQAEFDTHVSLKTISIPRAAIHPAALIPGDGVSNQFISKTYYDSLLQTLEKMGYEQNRTLFPWQYNPIESFVDTAESLASEIALWEESTLEVPWVWRSSGNQTSFDIMAHSAGVMVTRAYAQLTPITNYTPVNKLLLAGGTNKGILSNYAAREGLEADNLVFEFLLGPVLAQKSFECGNYSIVQGHFRVTDENKYQTLHDRSCGILSAPEQLPAPGPNDPAYLIDANNNRYPYPASPGSPNGYQYNPLLQGEPTDLLIYPQKDPWWMPSNPHPGTIYYNLNGRVLEDLAYHNIPAQNVHIFYSDNIETNRTYTVTNPSSVSPLWRNGIWSGEDQDTIKDSGDDAVALYSAMASDLWPGFTPHRLVFVESDTGRDSRPEKHGNLMVYPESQQEIGLTLSGIGLPFSTPMNAVNEFFQILGSPRVINGFGLSPIELLVTDPQGRRLGYDPTSDQILTEIPLGIYVHPTDQPVGFAIYAPLTGNYTITVTGIGNGPYTLLDVFTDEHSSVPILFEQNEIQQGETYTTTMSVPTNSGDVPYPPDVNAGIDITTIVAVPVEFVGTIKDINPNDTFNVQWDFGDGSTSTGTLTPAHAYTVPGTYTVTLSVTDSSGFIVSDTLLTTVTLAITHTPTTTSTNTPTATPTSGAFTFTPVADAYVNADSPTTNYGSSTTLRTDASPVVRSYLRFNVQGLNSAVSRATLRVFANSGSSQGYQVMPVSDNTWAENTINYNNMPSVGASVGSSGTFGAGVWTTVDVTPYITGNGVYNLALTTLSTTNISFASREAGANAPQLVIETGGSTATPTFTPTATTTSTPTSPFTPTSTPTATATPSQTVTPTPPTPGSAFYLSLSGQATLGGVTAEDTDILYYNGTAWSLFFDASDVGVTDSGNDLNDFYIADADTILLTFRDPITLGSLAVDPYDVVQFDATSLGDTTAGTFSLYFDGGDVGLDDPVAEMLNGFDVLPDGRLLFSTDGSFTVPGLTGKDEDIFAFTPTTLGETTSGTWAMYFDGSLAGIGLGDTGEDVDMLDVASNGDIYLSAESTFAVPASSGEDEDIFVCTPTFTSGAVSSCSYSSTLGSAWGLESNDVDALFLP